MSTPASWNWAKKALNISSAQMFSWTFHMKSKAFLQVQRHAAQMFFFFFRHSFHPPIPEMAEDIETWPSLIYWRKNHTLLTYDTNQICMSKCKGNPSETSDFLSPSSWGMYMYRPQISRLSFHKSNKNGSFGWPPNPNKEHLSTCRNKQRYLGKSAV